jgi:hypothetical protein
MAAVRCRFCRSSTGELVLDLGEQPACEYFPPLSAPGDPLFPLRLWWCAGCGLAQLADDVRLPDQPEGREPAALTRQRAEAVAAVRAAGLLPAGARFAEGGTPHGGSWWPEVAALGLRRAGEGEPADVVVDGSFGLMHEPDQRAALERLVGRVAPGGALVLQFHTLAAILAAGEWNAVRHGHYAYYSLPSVRTMLASLGMQVETVRSFDLYGGTVLVTARRDGSPDRAVAAAAADEVARGVLDPGRLRALQAEVGASCAALREFVGAAVGRGQRVFGYSAASRAVGLLHLAGVDARMLRGIADASPAKQGCRMPGTSVPVVPPEELVAARPDLVLLFVPDLLAEVRAALPEIEAGGGRWVTLGASTPTAAVPG